MRSVPAALERISLHVGPAHVFRAEQSNAHIFTVHIVESIRLARAELGIDLAVGAVDLVLRLTVAMDNAAILELLKTCTRQIAGHLHVFESESTYSRIVASSLVSLVFRSLSCVYYSNVCSLVASHDVVCVRSVCPRYHVYCSFQFTSHKKGAPNCLYPVDEICLTHSVLHNCVWESVLALFPLTQLCLGWCE